MEFLRPILVKIKLIFQEPAMTRPTGVIGVIPPDVGSWIGWLGTDAVFRVRFFTQYMGLYVLSLTIYLVLMLLPLVFGHELSVFRKGIVNKKNLLMINNFRFEFAEWLSYSSIEFYLVYLSFKLYFQKMDHIMISVKRPRLWKKKGWNINDKFHIQSL